MSKRIIIDVGNKYGNMNVGAAMFPENFTIEDRWAAFNLSREQMGYDYGFDGHKIFMADQMDQKGTSFEITNEYVEAYPNGWSAIPEDILTMKDDVKGVAIGHAVADCPVVMAYDNRQKVVAIGHCSSALVDKKFPKIIIDTLTGKYHSKDEDISVYVSSGADKKSYIYNQYPTWATDSKVWDEMITEDIANGIFYIDLKGAIKRELIERNIKEENIDISKIDTITDPNYYSNAGVYQGHPEKKGRNFPCTVFLDEETKGKSR